MRRHHVRRSNQDRRLRRLEASLDRRLCRVEASLRRIEALLTAPASAPSPMHVPDVGPWNVRPASPEPTCVCRFNTGFAREACPVHNPRPKIILHSNIRAAINRAVDACAPDIKYIRYDVAGSDDGLVVFFRVLFNNDAVFDNGASRLRSSFGLRFLATCKKIKSILHESIDPSIKHVYHNFRSEAEQLQLREPDWEPPLLTKESRKV